MSRKFGLGLPANFDLGLPAHFDTGCSYDSELECRYCHRLFKVDPKLQGKVDAESPFCICPRCMKKVLRRAREGRKGGLLGRFIHACCGG